MTISGILQFGSLKIAGMVRKNLLAIRHDNLGYEERFIIALAKLHSEVGWTWMPGTSQASVCRLNVNRSAVD